MLPHRYLVPFRIFSLFVGQSFLVIICSVKVYLKLDVTRERVRQTCHKGANFDCFFF